MPGRARQLVKSPEAKRRLRYFTAALFGVVAALSWWNIYTEGRSTARLITAVVGTVVAVIEISFPERRRLRGRNRNDDSRGTT
jgi:hypothetical protein